MKLGGIVNPKGEIKCDAVVLKLKSDKRLYLFVIEWIDKGKPDFVGEFWAKMQVAMRCLDTKKPHFFLIEADVLSNALILCPPMIKPGKHEVEFDYDRYEVAARDQGLPSITVDCGYIKSITSIKPVVRNKIVDKNPEMVGESAPKTVD